VKAPGSGAWLALLCSSRVLAATWFVAYSAVLPLTQAAWSLSARQAGMIQAAFHLGYLTSLFIVGFIADHFGAKRAYLTTGIADSSTHSTVLAESVPPHYLGVAYAIRSVVGFGAGVVSPVVFGWALDLAGEGAGWGIAWSTLGLGAALGPIVTWKLHRGAR
jgi:MFS family permease